VRLRMPLTRVYRTRTAIGIPSGLPALSAEQDFSTERTLEPAISWIPAFQATMATAYISGPRAGSSLRLRVPAMHPLSLFNPPESHFRRRAVTNAKQGVNLHARGWPGMASRVLSQMMPRGPSLT